MKNETAIALGYFDGVHLGHRAVIQTAVTYAQNSNLEPAIFTFSLDEELPASRGGDILSQRQKEKRIEALGIEQYVCPPASTFYQNSAKWFVQEILHEKLKAKTVFCGRDFTIGKGKEAGVNALEKLCAEYGITVIVVEDVQENGKPVSSTRIRNALKEGNMQEANVLLREPYAIDFEVMHGKKIGRTIGRPTINQIYPPHILSPQFGVYVTEVYLNGKTYAAATGFGTRPTVSGDSASAETFIIGFDGDLYGEAVETTFYRYLYPQEKFATLEELSARIDSAVKAAEEDKVARDKQEKYQLNKGHLQI